MNCIHQYGCLHQSSSNHHGCGVGGCRDRYKVNNNQSIAPQHDELMIGKFKIRKEGNLIFIRHSSGESGGFCPDLFEKCIEKFFNDNF